MKLDPLELKTDTRGSLVEVFKLPNDGQIFYITVNPGEMRGNHYHLRKHEYFCVISGSAVLSVKNRETGDVLKIETNGSRPMLSEVLPNHTHNITSEQGCMCLIWTNEQFNPDDPDTYAEEL